MYMSNQLKSLFKSDIAIPRPKQAHWKSDRPGHSHR